MKKASDKAKQAAQDAAAAAQAAARSLVDALQSEADQLAQAIKSFRDQMTDAITGGAIDFSKLILNADGSNGGLSTLTSNLNDMLTKTQQFSDDLNALASCRRLAGSDRADRGSGSGRG
jgi:cell division septum initiation protein DivIVA